MYMLLNEKFKNKLLGLGVPLDNQHLRWTADLSPYFRRYHLDRLVALVWRLFAAPRVPAAGCALFVGRVGDNLGLLTCCPPARDLGLALRWLPGPLLLLETKETRNTNYLYYFTATYSTSVVGKATWSMDIPFFVCIRGQSSVVRGVQERNSQIIGEQSSSQ
jgi:hypothetical protein